MCFHLKLKMSSNVYGQYFVNYFKLSDLHSEAYLTIMLNGIEFYRIFKSAIEKYGRDLEHNTMLQNNFINAWRSIDNIPHDLAMDACKIPDEIRRLSSRLQFSERMNIFSNAHKGLLVRTKWHNYYAQYYEYSNHLHIKSIKDT